MLASFACDPNRSRGRLVAENASSHRTAFQRDRDRIIHSTAFRRLKHKTQVFVEHEGDHFRTRLTHTIEVGQVARTIAKVLGLNIELTEAVALAHDLGHTPFGHTGEDALAACMAPYGGFDHNAQAIRIVTKLEKHYAEFDGLNLTWESLEGIAKHNGPVVGKLPYALAEYNARHDLELHTHASAEAQVAAVSDDVAYNNHDLDDGLRAGLFTIDDLKHLPIIGDCVAEVDRAYPDLDPERRHHESLRRVFGVMVEDVISESQRLLANAAPRSAYEVRNLGVQMVQFSESIRSDIKVIRQYLFENMYRADSVRRMREHTAQVVTDLFKAFIADPSLLPDGWVDPAMDDTALARAISDYIAGMTDRYALDRHAKLIG